jgi:hypothetical protein
LLPFATQNGSQYRGLILLLLLLLPYRRGYFQHNRFQPNWPTAAVGA